MEWFTDAKRVGKVAIPVGAVGVLLLIVGLTTSTWVLAIGIALVAVSGGMWTLHGIAEDQE